jgi:4-hydroxybenzoate polyprenyltransferase
MYYETVSTSYAGYTANYLHNELKGLIKYIQNFITFLMVSSLFTGATGFFATYTAYLLFGMNPSIQVCFEVFLTVFSVYSLNKLTDMKEDAINMPERLNFIEGRKKLVLCYSLAAYALSAVLVLADKPSSLPIILTPIACNALYSSRRIPGIPRFKDIPVMKNVFVSLSWTLVCTLMPAVHMANISPATIIVVIYFMLIKLFINAVLYDIRDVEGDRENGIKTLPVIIGPKKTVAILLGLNCTLIPWLTIAAPGIKLFSAALMLYGFIYVICFRKRRNPMLMDIFVDGEWMIACTALAVLQFIGWQVLAAA